MPNKPLHQSNPTSDVVRSLRIVSRFPTPPRHRHSYPLYIERESQQKLFAIVVRFRDLFLGRWDRVAARCS